MQKVGEEELGELVARTLREKGVEARTSRIDYVVPEDVLHRYGPQKVLKVAMDYGFLITRCCVNKQVKANGVWITPEGELAERAARYGNMTDEIADSKYQEQMIADLLKHREEWKHKKNVPIEQRTREWVRENIGAADYAA